MNCKYLVSIQSCYDGTKYAVFYTFKDHINLNMFSYHIVSVNNAFEDIGKDEEGRI